jgi:RNA polymerase sigma factor (sigma-70 family)
LPEQEQNERFEQAVMPHLHAAYNLARWLARNDSDAEDLVQESYLRAFRFFGGFRGGDARAWLLKIVRNTCHTWFHENRKQELSTEFDEEIHTVEGESPDPEALLLRGADAELLRQALEELPLEFREALVLRELEGLSYKEIAEISGISMGTVMSRLSRARHRLEIALTSRTGRER